MVRIVLEDSVIRSAPLREMGRQLGWDTAQAVGALVLLWAQTRDAGFVEGTPADLFPHLPAEPSRRPAVFKALVDAGFIEKRAAGVYAVVGNAENMALIAKRREAGKKGRAKTTLVANERLAARARRAEAKAKKAAPPAKPVLKKKKASRIKAVAKPPAAQQANRAAWDAYESAFVARWGVSPTRNARVNACVAQFVQRIGQQDAPDVLRFYVGHNDAMYLRSHHAMTLAVRDAEGLHAQWRRGQAVTSHDIRRMEDAGGVADQLRRIGMGEL